MIYRDKRTTQLDREQAEKGINRPSPALLTTTLIKGEATRYRVLEIAQFEDNVCLVQERHKSSDKTPPEINSVYFGTLSYL